MDYEKAYKEALERAEGLIDFCSDSELKTLEYVFPELKESEDERIRGAIMHFISHTPTVPKGIINKEQMLAWLEKQGEKLQGKSALEAAKEDKVDSQNCVNPADKIETKFKVGDWITNDYCAGKVIELTNDAYLLDTGQGIPFSCEHNVHLWTIQDAKDGDVLVASDDSVFIYAGSTDRHAQFYIALSKCGDFNTEGGNWEDKKCVKPATKEQRDNLMKAMADAGWKFDFEKKELKKIEQKPAAWKPSDEQMKALADALSLAKSCGEEMAFDLRTLYKQLKKL